MISYKTLTTPNLAEVVKWSKSTLISFKKVKRCWEMTTKNLKNSIRNNKNISKKKLNRKASTLVSTGTNWITEEQVKLLEQVAWLVAEILRKRVTTLTLK